MSNTVPHFHWILTCKFFYGIMSVIQGSIKVKGLILRSNSEKNICNKYKYQQT